jgi:hypothetical protein
MPVTTGSIITAAFYNALQSSIATILGVGGYGQTVTSSQVTNILVDQVVHWSRLKTDIQLCRAMQQGVAFTEAQLPTVTTAMLIRASDINLYEAAVNTVVGAYAGNMMLVMDAFSDTRTTTWTTSINDSVLIDFGTVAAANAFFANSGELRMVLTQPTRPTPHDVSWHSSFNGTGTVILGNSGTTRSGTMGVPATTNGWTTLTTTDSVIFNGTNLNTTTYAYGGAGDDIMINAKKNSTGTGVIITTSLANNKTDTISASTKLSFGYKKRYDASAPTFAFNASNTFNV